jgi:hypothetical protein
MIEVHVSNLQRKLNMDGINPLMETLLTEATDCGKKDE